MPKKAVIKSRRRTSRKPLTEEQKEERKERLAAARAKRAPSTHKSVHPDVPRDPVHPWNVDNIKRWIKTNQDELSSLKSQVKKDFDRKQNDRLNSLECYVENLKSYLRTGVYLDFRYGEQMEGRVRRVCRVPAYHWYGPHKGLMKLDIGVHYPGYGVITEEIYAEHYGIPLESVGKPEEYGKTTIETKPKRKRKPMTDEQKEAARARLAKARAAKKQKTK